MAIDSEYVKLYPQGDDVSSGEIKNQQLNDALATGTVNRILLKSGYIPSSAYDVVIKQNLDDYAKLTEISTALSLASLNYRTFQEFPRNPDKTFQLKYSGTYNAVPAAPTYTNLNLPGEIAVDNYDASLYTLSFYVKNSSGIMEARPEPVPVKIDAGTVNSFVVERDVKAGIGDDAMMSREEIKDLINSAFIYDSGTGALTITAL